MEIETKDAIFAVVRTSLRSVRSWHRSPEAARKAWAKQPFGVCIVETDMDSVRANWVPNNENTRYVEAGEGCDIAGEKCVLDAAEIVVGEGYASTTPREHLEDPAVVDELLRKGYTYAQVRICHHRSNLTIFRLD